MDKIPRILTEDESGQYAAEKHGGKENQKMGIHGKPFFIVRMLQADG